MKKLLAIVLTLIVLTLAITSCGAKAVTGITIDEGLVREYNLNATPDFSGVKATVTSLPLLKFSSRWPRPIGRWETKPVLWLPSNRA